MHRLVFSALVGSLLSAMPVLAEPVDMPHTFAPNTPAKASEVNANLQELATAIGNLKRVSLYQDGNKIGSSILANLIKLDSGYVALLSKNKGSNDIVLKEGAKVLYYTSSNGTGTAYTDRVLREDLLSGETGIVAGFRDMAFYMNTPATPSTISVDSFWDEDNAQYTSITGYVANPACGTMLDEGGTSRNIRCNQVVYTLNGCTGGMGGACWLDGAYWTNGSTYTLKQRYDTNNWTWIPSQIMSSFPTSTITQGSLLTPAVLTTEVDGTGYVVNAYALTPNNSAITGISTRSGCTDHKSRPVVCLPTNAQLISE